MPRTPTSRSKPKAAKANEQRLRRIALEHLGLVGKDPFGRGQPAAGRMISSIGYLQIDTISVVARAHDHVLHNRVSNYAPPMLRKLLQRREIFEYWDHAAAFLPIDEYRFTLPRQQALQRGELKWLRQRDRKQEQLVLDRIRDEGPLRARDFEGPERKGAGWWSWKPAKRALENLFFTGELMCSDRDGFQKVYDLRERVLPDHIDVRVPTPEEHADYAIDRALRSVGMVNPKSACYLQRLPSLRQAVATRFAERCATGELKAIKLASGETMAVRPEVLAGRRKPLRPSVHILSPFDPLVIQRQRTQALFGFDYVIECYVPAAKRRYGYYSLPVLYGDTICARMDCKAHRDQGRFEIKALHLEPGFEPTEDFATAFASAVDRYAAFNDCDHATLTRCEPKRWTKPLAAQLAS